MKTYITGLVWSVWQLAQAQPNQAASTDRSTEVTAVSSRFAGAVVTLEQCYAAARATYPLLKQQGILQQTGDLAVATLSTNRRLPQLSVNGQSSWQSEVTQLPIELPNLTIPVLSKDQYILTLDAN